MSDEETPGWDAIDNALQPLYASQEPKHFGTLVPWELGGPDPLAGISVYRRQDPLPHWHFVTYGFSELYEKKSENHNHSGWGFELTMRLRIHDEAQEPPSWALSLLQNLARYVFNSGNVFNQGDYMNANGPIALQEDTQITSMAFARDPELAPMSTANGRVEFLQVIGITDDEELALKQWSTMKVLDVFKSRMPMWITDLGRESLLLDGQIQDAVLEGAGREGSNTGYVFIDKLAFFNNTGGYDHILEIGARQVMEIKTIMPYRLNFGEDFALVSRELSVQLVPGESCRVQTGADGVTVVLTAEAVGELTEVLRPERGDYPLASFPALLVRVRPTVISDSEGKTVRTIG